AIFLRRMAVTYLEDHAQHVESLLSDEVFDSTRTSARRNFASPTNRAIWMTRLRQTFTTKEAEAFEGFAIIGVPLRSAINEAGMLESLRATRERLLADAVSSTPR